MDTDIGWELYRSFLSVLQEGSLSGAARALGVAQPTVGRHMVALEKSLGVVLFTRSQLGLMPTEAALALKAHAQAMSSSAAALKRAAESQGAGVRGTVRISASGVVGVEVLPPIVARLKDQYPLLKVELVLTNKVQDLLLREADIAVRMTAMSASLSSRSCTLFVSTSSTFSRGYWSFKRATMGGSTSTPTTSLALIRTVPLTPAP